MEYVIDLERIQGHNEYWEYKLYRITKENLNMDDVDILLNGVNVEVMELLKRDGSHGSRDDALKAVRDEIRKRGEWYGYG